MTHDPDDPRYTTVHGGVQVPNTGVDPMLDQFVHVRDGDYITCSVDGLFDLLRRVRADERSLVTPAAVDTGARQGYARALHRAERAVREECFHDDGEWCIFVDAIRKLKEA